MSSVTVFAVVCLQVVGYCAPVVGGPAVVVVAVVVGNSVVSSINGVVVGSAMVVVADVVGGSVVSLSFVLSSPIGIIEGTAPHLIATSII